MYEKKTKSFQKARNDFFQNAQTFLLRVRNKKFCLQPIISMGKGNSVSFCPARLYKFLKKSPRLRFASGSIFPKNLAGQDTELIVAH
jgi:hypothetical protein